MWFYSMILNILWTGQVSIKMAKERTHILKTRKKRQLKFLRHIIRKEGSEKLKHMGHRDDKSSKRIT